MGALSWDRFQFAFTITYHYLFPQLTMGLALLLVVFKLMFLRTRDEAYNNAAMFWARVFGVNFAVGVVTGIPMEFQFGTNWAAFSNMAGGVIGLSLAMEGLFAFFAESAFLGIFLYGDKRFGEKIHLLSSIMLLFGSWLSGYFIIVTNAFMQHPIGYGVAKNGSLYLNQFWAYLLNPWALWEYAHNMTATVITASFVVAAVGAFYLLLGRHKKSAAVFLKVALVSGLIASLIQIFPTGDGQGKMVATYQKPTLAAMEGKFHTGNNADLVILGQPDVSTGKIENPIRVPYLLSFLAYGTSSANVRGLNSFPKNVRPDNVELLYYAYHIMVGLGTLFILILGIGVIMLRNNRLFSSRPMLWILMLSFPFPYIATIAGWMVAEIGRQPWVIYGLMRTAKGISPTVSGGDTAFTTLGFMGLYTIMGVLFLYMIAKILTHGPDENSAETPFNSSIPAQSA